MSSDKNEKSVWKAEMVSEKLKLTRVGAAPTDTFDEMNVENNRNMTNTSQQCETSAFPLSTCNSGRDQSNTPDSEDYINVSDTEIEIEDESLIMKLRIATLKNCHIDSITDLDILQFRLDQAHLIIRMADRKIDIQNAVISKLEEKNQVLRSIAAFGEVKNDNSTQDANGSDAHVETIVIHNDSDDQVDVTNAQLPKIESIINLDSDNEQ